MQPDDLEPRVAALEAQVRELATRVRSSEQDAAAARVLAGAADRDVAEFLRESRDFRQATVATFNALREDFGDLRTDVQCLRTDVDRGFTEMRGRFDATAAGQQQIAELIQQLAADRGENGPSGQRHT